MVSKDHTENRIPLSQGPENEPEKKQPLFSRFFKKKNVLAVDKNEMLLERERLRTDIEGLENKNHLSSKKLNDLKFRITEKKNEKEKVERETEEQNKELVRLLTQESSMANEIEFYNSEKDEISDIFEKISHNMDSRVHDMEKSIKDIGFIKGETGSLIEKMSTMEKDIPEKNTNIEAIDDSIFGAVKSLKQLYSRMQKIEKQAKVHYYNNKEK